MNNNKAPDPMNHFKISMIKSAVRIVAGLILCFGWLAACGILLIIAELLGVVEEVV